MGINGRQAVGAKSSYAYSLTLSCLNKAHLLLVPIASQWIRRLSSNIGGKHLGEGHPWRDDSPLGRTNQCLHCGSQSNGRRITAHSDEKERDRSCLSSVALRGPPYGLCRSGCEYSVWWIFRRQGPTTVIVRMRRMKLTSFGETQQSANCGDPLEWVWGYCQFRVNETEPG